MNAIQREAIQAHLPKISEIFVWAAEIFLSYLERHPRRVISSVEVQIINSEKTSDTKLDVLIKILKTKDNAWEAIIDYLRNNGSDKLAKELDDYVKGSTVPTDPYVKKDKVVEFKDKLIDYYRAEYCKVSTMFGCYKHIKDVWVSLTIGEKTENPLQSIIDHNEMLKRLADIHASSIALVRGQPGIGKTTLAKKIAFDWANGNITQFSMVLAVPLRYVDPTDDFLQLTMDYYAKELRLSKEDKLEIIYWLNQLGRKLLICLDGLDEYRGLAESPFRTLFAAAFTDSPVTFSRFQPPTLPYKLLITSRPYILEQANRDFFPLRFEICPLDSNQLDEFVQRYCANKDGVKKVTEYLRSDVNSVIPVPLILMFVCSLTEVRKEIPSNLTLLYESLLNHMLKTEMEGGKLTESIVMSSWKVSEVMKRTSLLAFDGCKKGKLDFCIEEQGKFEITEDSFKCGFLLQKFDFVHQELCAEFPHRSIQEFFAAFHCYNLISTADKTERNSIMKQILDGDSQFGRFFFGMSSKEGKFEKMLNWLNPTLKDAKIISFKFNHFFVFLSESLTDCSVDEGLMMGQRLLTSLAELENEMRNAKNQAKDLMNHHFYLFNQSLKCGLNMNFLDEIGIPIWSLSPVDQPKWSELAYVRFYPPKDLRDKFERIQILMWRWNIYKLTEMMSALELLPPVSTLIVQTNPGLEVNFDLEYEMAETLTSTASQLRYFTVGFCEEEIGSLESALSREPESNHLIIRESKKTEESAEVTFVKITVKQNYDLPDLVLILIRWALQIHNSKVEQPQKRRKTHR